MQDFIVVLGVVAGCFTIFQLGRCYEIAREIRFRNDEAELKLKRN